MYLILSQFLHWAYLLLPPAALAMAIIQARRGKRRDGVPLFLLTCASAIFISAGVTAAYAAFLGGRLHATQVAVTWYFIVGLLCLIKLLRWVIGQVVFRALFVKRDLAGNPLRSSGIRGAIGKSIQTALLVVITLPLVIGAMAIRRVRLVPIRTPEQALDWDYTPVEFDAMDGNRVAGWWIPAEPMPADSIPNRAVDWGRRTVLLCHGLGEDRRRQMGLIWLFASDGYNVLAIDLRGQGESGGQWGSFGDIERNDVLGAVRWLKTSYPEAARKIYGMGSGTAGAALIAAATDHAPGGETWGRQIDALAVVGTFADFQQEVQDMTEGRLPKAVSWFATRVVVPFASAHAGTDLMHFSPAKLVDELWPRPILVIHGRQDAVVPFSQGWDLFHAAGLPKQSLWLSGDHSSVLRDPETARTVRDFFFHARAVPVI